MRITLWPEKNSWFRRNTTLILCVLTMLLLTLGISEQGSTIAQQKDLIRVLAQDSQTLMAMRAQQTNEAQRKADPQVAPESETGALQAPPADVQEKRKSKRSEGVEPKQRAPKADVVIDLKEVGRVLHKS